MIDKYTDSQTTFRRERVLEWDVLDSLLHASNDSEGDLP